jgi:hypothetical protein
LNGSGCSSVYSAYLAHLGPGLCPRASKKKSVGALLRIYFPSLKTVSPWHGNLPEHCCLSSGWLLSVCLAVLSLHGKILWYLILRDLQWREKMESKLCFSKRDL